MIEEVNVVRQVHQPILPWIDCLPDRMSRDDTEGAIVREGEVYDGIPHMHLPWGWFKKNRGKKHVHTDYDRGVARRHVASSTSSTRGERERKDARKDAEPPAAVGATEREDLDKDQKTREAHRGNSTLIRGEGSVHDGVENIGIRKPDPVPIAFEDARILPGRDTCRIMGGESPEQVIAHRKEILAGKVEESLERANPIPPPVMKQVWRHVPAPPKDRMPKISLRQYHDMSNNTWINVSGKPIPIDFPNSKYKFVLQPHEGVWLTPMVFESQRFKVGQVLPASEVHRQSMIGKIDLDEDLKRSLQQSGIKVKK